MKLGSGPRQLQHLLVFKRLTEVKDESDGSVTESWVKDFSEFAEIVSGKSDEVFESQRRNALATWPQYVSSEIYIFRIRHHDGIDSLKHRILFDGKLFTIFPPIRDNKRGWMRIQATFLKFEDNDGN